MAGRTYTNVDGIPGYFGRIGADTHFPYGAYPCLAICAKRILADVAHTNTDPAFWNLPEAIAPTPVEGVDFGNPSENMVGYGPAVTLGRGQKTWLANCGIRADAFPSCNASIPLNPQLLEAVSSCLDESKAFKFSPAAKGGFEGSQAQTTYIRVKKSWFKKCRFLWRWRLQQPRGYKGHIWHK